MLGEEINLESRNLLFRSLFSSVVTIWKRVWKCALHLYLIILKLVLGEGFRLESRNLLFRSLFASVVKTWKWLWICAIYL